MSEVYNTTSGNGYTVPKYSDGVDGPGAFKEFADGLDSEHIVPIKTDVAKNTNAIGINAGDINSLSNRLNALENTTLSAEWKIRVDGGGPNAGEVSLDSDVWAAVKVLTLSLKDANGVDHDFANVKSGDTIQIGVGPDAKLAGSSAAYTVDSVAPGGEFGVTHLASTGAPAPGFTAIIAVYPAFDPSNYATTAELDAVKTDKLSKGAGLVAADAKVLEDRIDENAEGIKDKFATGVGPLDYGDATVLGQAVKTNEEGISQNSTNINNLAKELNLEINTDGSINIIGGGEVPDLNELEKGIEDNATDIKGKFNLGTGTTTLNDATVMEEAIDKNAVNIEANKTNIENVVTIIGGEVTDGNIILPKPIDIDSKFDIGAGTTNLNDATAMEAAIGANTENVTKLIAGLGGDIENIEIDGLPDQGGKDGLFLQTNGTVASWAAPKTGDIKLSADDAGLFVEVDGLGTFDDQSDVNTYIAEHGVFKKSDIVTWGDLAGKP